MKDIGIIFQGWGVRAILEDRKSVTRRTRGLEVFNSDAFKDVVGEWNYLNGFWSFTQEGTHGPLPFVVRCPYGDKGDLLYGKEALINIDGWAHYQADMTPVTIGGPGINEGVKWEWKRPYLPGMFMPKWASRLPLINTGSRPELLQDIRTRDILKEGYLIKCMPLSEEEKKIIRESGALDIAMAGLDSLRKDPLPPKPWFIQIWDSINSKKHPWASNPWVWRVEFRRVEG